MTRLQARTQIEMHLANPGPFSHNIIGIILSSIAKRYGAPEANRLIIQFELEKHGWKLVETGYQKGKRMGVK